MLDAVKKAFLESTHTGPRAKILALQNVMANLYKVALDGNEELDIVLFISSLKGMFDVDMDRDPLPELNRVGDRSQQPPFEPVGPGVAGANREADGAEVASGSGPNKPAQGPNESAQGPTPGEAEAGGS